MFKEGTMRFTSSLMGMWTHAEHEVAPNQPEPNIAPEDQASDHVLDIGFSIFSLRGEYVPADGWAVALQVPIRGADVLADFHDDEGQLMEGFESIHHRDELLIGLGDPELSGIWQAVGARADQPWSLQFSLGLSVPLGTTEPDPFVLGEEGQTHQHLFFGTGTFDPVVGAELRYVGSGWASRLWTASRASVYANEHGYRGPGVTEAGLGLLTSFGLPRLSFLLEVGAMHEAPARWDGERAKNSGRTEILASLGMSWMASADWTISALAKRSVYTEVLGGQMEIPLLSVISVTYTGSVAEPLRAQ